MRVITGTARGRSLVTLAGEDVVRPTSEKVKEAVFSIIQFELEGRRVLDMFAGSGQMGIEALSRGARECVFLDSERRSIDVVRKNVITADVADRAVIIQADAVSYVAGSRTSFDIAFLDPPYALGLVQKSLPHLVQCVNHGGVIICESAIGEELPETAGDFRIYREYKYSKTKITVYRDTD